ncbi:hypothetical protein BC629DRAFT_1446398 [Irpex lacteus]|nr:hypothetical protein BC629DRAFT_1446398 [Irpex lacteus]
MLLTAVYIALTGVTAVAIVSVLLCQYALLTRILGALRPTAASPILDIAFWDLQYAPVTAVVDVAQSTSEVLAAGVIEREDAQVEVEVDTPVTATLSLPSTRDWNVIYQADQSLVFTPKSTSNEAARTELAAMNSLDAEAALKLDNSGSGSYQYRPRPGAIKDTCVKQADKRQNTIPKTNDMKL